MMKPAFLLSILAASADAATKVAVLELGRGGVVRRTTSTRTAASVTSVASFWGALHGRQLQHSDMPLVPDLFNKADRFMVLGITGADLDTMPVLANMIEGEAVGQMEVEGKHCKSLMNKAGPAKVSSVKDAVVDAQMTMSKTGLNAMSLKVTEGNVEAVESQLQAILNALRAGATDGKTFVLHLVVEENDEAAQRRLEVIHRRLESRDLQNNNNNANNAAAVNNQNGYYGYGYINKYGVYYSPYKTMFQIQYFNVVLWTSIGLVVLVFVTVSMMVGMPLEADTLLFGESAKMIGE